MVGHLNGGIILIISTENRLRVYSPVQLLFCHDMILLIKLKVYWSLIFQRKQTRINKDTIRKNIKQVDHDYKVRDKFMLNNNTACDHETPYSGPFVVTQCWTNGTVTLQYVPKKWNNIRRIKPYRSDTNIEDINPENMYDNVNI